MCDIIFWIGSTAADETTQTSRRRPQKHQKNIKVVTMRVVLMTTTTTIFALLQPRLCSGFTTTPTPMRSSSLTTTVPTHRQSSRLQAGGGIEFIDPSYNLALGSFGVGLVGGFLEDVRNSEGTKLVTAKLFGSLALIFTLFSAFLAIQTTTLRFTFDDQAIALVRPDGSSIGDNIKVGGENKWSYSSIQNWDFLPTEDFPILIYFRETQTPVENRATAPIVVDDLDGQVHFFPAISDAQQFKNAFIKHDCARLE